MSRVGLLAVVTTIAIASIATRPASAAPGEDTEEPGARTPAEDTTSAPPAAAVAAVSEPAAPRRRRGDQVWGVGLRARYVSVPGWLLGQFTKQNVPLGTFGHFGIEGFRRGGNFQATLALSYQNMSPSDGNWLGNNHTPETDTRLLRFRGLSLFSFDASVSWQGMISRGSACTPAPGLGLAVVRGSIYVDVSHGCNDTNVGDTQPVPPASASPAPTASARRPRRRPVADQRRAAGVSHRQRVRRHGLSPARVRQGMGSEDRGRFLRRVLSRPRHRLHLLT